LPLGCLFGLPGAASGVASLEADALELGLGDMAEPVALDYPELASVYPITEGFAGKARALGGLGNGERPHGLGGSPAAPGNLPQEAASRADARHKAGQLYKANDAGPKSDFRQHKGVRTRIRPAGYRGKGVEF
jgi:hypothetical protein